MHMNLGMLGRLVALTHTRHVADLPRLCLRPETLWVSLGANLWRGFNPDLKELVIGEQCARRVTIRVERRNQRHNRDDPGVDEQFGDLGNPADILLAVFWGKAEIAV